MLMGRLFIRSALIDVVFTRLLAALLVAARQFRATKYVVALHCGRSAARQRGQEVVAFAITKQGLLNSELLKHWKAGWSPEAQATIEPAGSSRWNDV
jgi:hypothetical protein